MSDTGYIKTALDSTRSSNDFVMRVEDNTVFQELLIELKKVNQQLAIITGENLDDY